MSSAESPHQENTIRDEFVEAAKNGHIEVVKELMRAGMKNEGLIDGMGEALYWVAVRGHIEVMKYLIETVV